jgi:hypothetical protein
MARAPHAGAEDAELARSFLRHRHAKGVKLRDFRMEGSAPLVVHQDAMRVRHLVDSVVAARCIALLT